MGPKKLRFEVFKRDNFTCQYCGRKTPSVVLEMDHIVPVAEGGTDGQNNLITSCFDCNRGKGKTKLSRSELTTSRAQEIEEEVERQEQIKEYEAVIRKRNASEKRAVTRLRSYWEEKNDCEYTWNDSGNQTVKSFLKNLSYLEIKEAIDIAAARVPPTNIERRFKYFCGICHNMVAEKKGDVNRVIYRKAKSFWLRQGRGSGYFVEWKLREICSDYSEEEIIGAIDEAHSRGRTNYWDAFLEILGERQHAKQDS